MQDACQVIKCTSAAFAIGRYFLGETRGLEKRISS